MLEDEPWRRERLHAVAERFRVGATALGYDTGPSETQIIPLIVGEAEVALDMEARLTEAGFLAKAVRPPTVPAGTSRIRFNLSAAHEDDDVAQVLAALQRLSGRDA